MLTLDELRADVESGEIDTVVVAFTDMQGRLMGKRLHGEFFCDEMADEHPVEGCNYLLALDMEMDPIPGYEIASWERGYGDFAMKPDLATLRRIPWLEATALVLADVLWHDGTPVQPSPRQVLEAQMERASALGFTPMAGSELEFYLLRESYEEAWAQRYEDLTPSVPYILDYHILATTYDEDLIRQIRNGMHAAGIKVETSKGEAWPGQHEINFRYADALTMADNHVIYKNGAKEIANLNGCSITFMAKPFESWIGNSCHIHASLFRDGEPAFRDDQQLFGRFLAGMISCFKELAVFLAPTINSYKRYAAGSWAPTTLAWGHDNRTCGFRVVGHGASRRVETRIPGGDVNPYLAFAAMIAAGLYGIENELELPAALEGNAYESDAERFPSSLREAIAALEDGSMARAAFGDQVVDHYLNYARTEQALFDKAVTDWERIRLYERGMRVVLISRILPAVIGYSAMLRELGHEPVALMCSRELADRYGGLGDLLAGAPAELDVVIPSRRDRIAPLLRSFEPDLALCTGFPWKIPAAALGVPKHGIVNGHPSLLPRYRGANPVAWAIRNGESEIGFTLHYMDEELDTGNVLAQVRIPLDDAQTWEDLEPKFGPIIGEIFPSMLARVERGDLGDPQSEDGATYYSFFEPEYAWIDWTRPAEEIARQVRAWRFHSPATPNGALAELDGETVRVLRASLEPADGREKRCGDGTLWIVETEPA